MSNAPSHNTSPHTPPAGDDVSPSGAGAYDPRDIETIDHELEAYLEEKRSGKRMRLDYSVDDQLSDIRAKFGARVKPTKESEKPRIIEEVRRSHHDQTPPVQPRASAPLPTNEKTEAETKNAALSHDEIIRSLEEKYSRGSSFTPGKTASAPPPREKSTPIQPLSQLLLDLKEHIEPLDPVRIDALLKQALVLDSEKQQELSDMFLARFKRNKERNKLFAHTQAELENELERFIQSAVKRTADKHAPAPQEPSPRAETQTPSRVPLPKEKTPITPAAKTPSRIPPSSNTPETTPSLSAFVSAPDISEKCKTFLLRLPKKPTVLMYDSTKGFVRKAVDPSDASLALSYATDPMNGLVIVSVHDERGNELGVLKFPQDEVGV